MFSANASIRVGLVGYGMAGKVFHAPLIRVTPGLELAAIVSRDPAKVHADLPGVHVMPDLDTLLADPAIDLVVIATPDALHAPQARAALEAGKHVIIDKPFALTLADAQAVATLAAARGLLLSVFQNRRWDADFLTLRRLIAEEMLGEVMQYESHFDRFRPHVADRWRERPGAGILLDLGPHLVDQALVLFGMPATIAADIGIQRRGGLAPDYCHLVLGYARLRVILHASQVIPDASLRFAVHGTRGSFVKRGLDPQEAASKAGTLPGSKGWGLDPIPATLTRVADDQTMAATELVCDRGDYPAFYAGVAAAIRGEAANPVPPEQALAVMKVLEMAQESAAEGRTVRV